MITINTEKGLVRIEHWHEIEERPGFVKDVDPTTAKLDAIIGSYQFSDLIRCGLSTCRQPHGRGYLVTTKDGRETNIGKDCGKTHFLVEFENMRRQFDRDLRRQERVETVTAAKHRAPALIEEIGTLRRESRGADWVHKLSKPLVTPGRDFPSYVVTAVRDMVRTRSPSITVQRVATEAEAEAMDVAERPGLDQRDDASRTRYVTEVVGTLDGLSALYPENDLRELIVIDLEPRLRELEQADVESLTDTELMRFVTWIADLDDKLDRAKSTVRAGRRLLEPRNVAQLGELARTPDDGRAITRFAKSLARE